MSGLFGLGGAPEAAPAANVPGLSVENMFAQIMGAVQKSVRRTLGSDLHRVVFGI